MTDIKKPLSLAACVSLSLVLAACTSSKTSESEPVVDSPAPLITDELVLSDSKLAKQYLEEGNLKGCDEITLENLKDQCRYNIVIANATKNSDPKICEDLSDPIEVDSCKASVNSLK